jgi:diadenosine tetraphosphate (Ap4A) HIT family hydrolase
MACDLCDTEGGEVLFRNAKLRVVAVRGSEAIFRGFCRVVWNNHVKELTDLSRDDRALFMDAVFRVETSLISSLNPDKMNVASLGNLTPHLHWHVIPRFSSDAAFPKPIWAITLTSANVAASSQMDEDSSAAWKDAVRFAMNRS